MTHKYQQKIPILIHIIIIIKISICYGEFTYPTRSFRNRDGRGTGCTITVRHIACVYRYPCCVDLTFSTCKQLMFAVAPGESAFYMHPTRDGHATVARAARSCVSQSIGSKFRASSEVS